MVSVCYQLVLFTVLSIAIINFSLLKICAIAATTAHSSRHIVSYVKQRKTMATADVLSEFDFENSSGVDDMSRQDVVQQLFGRLVQQLDTNLDNSIATPLQDNATKTDDLLMSQQNTLESLDQNLDNFEQHESSVASGQSNNSVWQRVKQSIPALEPVKHLLNTVRDGTFNQSSRQHHHLVSTHGGEHMHHLNDSSAIETEEEREMVNDSTGFKFLELLGTVAGMLWGFFSNIQKFFAASSASLSGSSSGGY